MSASAPSAALLVIDVQESFRHTPFWNEAGLPAFRDALLRLDAACRARGVPDEIKERTELVLTGRFARIASVDDALAAL